MSGGTPLCAEERETISRELGQNKSARYIAKLLGRHPSTIAREINRNGCAADYRAVSAQERYESLKERPKERKLVASSRLHDAVNEGLEHKWSPEQISERLNEEYPDDPEMKVSHETIYQTHLRNTVPASERRASHPAQTRVATGQDAARAPVTGHPEQGKDPKHGQHQRTPRRG
jgi:IS30 family transposase